MSVLTADSITVRLGGRTILDGVCARFLPGEVTAVIGPNGAGKSTLLTALAGLRKPDQGSVRLGETPLLSLRDKDRARRIGFLPQLSDVAWPLEVRTLVGLGLIPFERNADTSAVDDVLKAVGIESHAGRIVDTLSGGERTRVLLARALVGDPEWLLADEPLAGLDPAHVMETCAILTARARTGGKGVILTLHDLTTAWRIADRVIVLAEGGVIADGSPRDALTPATLARAYGVEARIGEGAGGGFVDIVGMSVPSPPSQKTEKTG